MTFIGRSGTFYGEDGFDIETGISMWPFPMEDIMKEKYSQYAYEGNTYEGGEHSRRISGTGMISGARGFAVQGQTLTNYIWGYLGNVVPPFSVTASLKGDYTLLQWSASAPVQQSEITGYKIYKVDEESRTLKLLQEVNKEVRFSLIKNLAGESVYNLTVTALRNDQESGIGLPVTVMIK